MLNKILNPIASYLPENNRIELIWKLAQVDFQKRYYNDKLGLAWALINPIMQVFIYFSIFSIWMGVEDPQKMILLLFSGLVVWMAFGEASGRGQTVFASKRYLIENLQFNKVDLFFSSNLSVTFGLFFNLAAYFACALFLGVEYSWQILYLPLLLLNMFMFFSGFSMILAWAQLFFKDIQHIWDMLLLLLSWTASIFFDIFPLLVGEKEIIKYIHPFVFYFENLRNIILYNKSFDWFYFSYSFGYSLILLIIGWFLIKLNEHNIIENL